MSLKNHTWRKEVVNQFDEEFYLTRYPDIKAAVERGQLPNALSHYLGWGHGEGRYPNAKEEIIAKAREKAPVAFFVFNRPEVTALTFKAIREYAPRKLFLIADAPRDAREKVKTDLVRELIATVDWECEVVRHYAASNMGCKQRIVSGLREVFLRVEDAIILEDDCLPNQDFFHFCYQMLKAYRNDHRVMHISGSCFVESDRTPRPGWLSRHSDIWGWATWRRAFAHYDADMKTWKRPLPFFDRWLGETALEREFWTRHFDQVQKGEIDTWDYQWHYTVYRRRGLSTFQTFFLFPFPIRSHK